MKTINVRLVATTVYVITMIGGILLLASIAGCSSTMAVDAYAREHNIYGQRVCNTQVADVEEADTLVRGCPTGEIVNIEGNIQNEDEGSVKKETAL